MSSSNPRMGACDVRARYGLAAERVSVIHNEVGLACFLGTVLFARGDPERLFEHERERERRGAQSGAPS